MTDDRQWSLWNPQTGAALMRIAAVFFLSLLALWGRVESRFSRLESASNESALRQEFTNDRLDRIEDSLKRLGAPIVTAQHP